MVIRGAAVPAGHVDPVVEPLETLLLRRQQPRMGQHGPADTN
jgi:hypothetical protein